MSIEKKTDFVRSGCLRADAQDERVKNIRQHQKTPKSRLATETKGGDEKIFAPTMSILKLERNAEFGIS